MVAGITVSDEQPRPVVASTLTRFSCVYQLACLLIPQGISYASQLGHLSPISGLYSAAVPALLYAVLGTCRYVPHVVPMRTPRPDCFPSLSDLSLPPSQLSVGPEAALSLLVGNTIMEVVSEIDRDPHHPLGATAKARIGVEVATCMGLQVSQPTPPGYIRPCSYTRS